MKPSTYQSPNLDVANTACKPQKHQLLNSIAAQYGPSLKLYLLNKLQGHHHDAEDMLQELYSRLWCYDRLHKIENLRGFVFTIAANIIRDNYRRSYTRASKVSACIDDHELSIENNDPQQVLESWQSLKSLDQQLAQVTPKCKQAFLLHRLEGFTQKEIALKMGVTTSMVEKHITSASKAVCRLPFGHA